jgi:RNA polymerase sigma-32 factor
MSAVSGASADFNARELYIMKHRLVVDEPDTLQELGDLFHVSRERIRQVETRIVRKLRASMLPGEAALLARQPA